MKRSRFIEEQITGILKEHTADVVAQPLRITDTATGKTWQRSFVLGHGGNKLRLVTAGEVQET